MLNQFYNWNNAIKKVLRVKHEWTVTNTNSTDNQLKIFNGAYIFDRHNKQQTQAVSGFLYFYGSYIIC